jgi:hypothetical protein
MSEDDRHALIHMLLAQREQINASLRLLAKEDPAAPAAPAEPRRFGQRSNPEDRHGGKKP